MQCLVISGINTLSHQPEGRYVITWFDLFICSMLVMCDKLALASFSSLMSGSDWQMPILCRVLFKITLSVSLENCPEILGCSQGRVPGVLEPPIWVMKMNIISRGKTCRNPPLEIPRDAIFVFEEEPKKIISKIHRMRYRNILRVHKLDGSCEPPVYRSLQCGNQ